jgi:uncharacterized membrane protein YkoI
MHKSAMQIGAFLLPALLLATAAEARTCDTVTYHAPGDFEGQIDQDGARAAVKRGDAAPFQQILEKARTHIHGEIVGQKLEQHRGVWVYEFRVIAPDGHMHYLHFAARSGAPHAVSPLP